MNARTRLRPAASRPEDPAARRRRVVIDAGVAIAYGIVFLAYPLAMLGRKAIYLPLVAGASASFDWSVMLVSLLSAAMVLVCAVALAQRRTRPRTSFLVICGVGAVQLVSGEPISLWNLAMLASLFSAAAYTDREFGRLTLAIAAVGYIGIWVQITGLLAILPRLPNIPDVLISSRGAAFVAIFGLLVLIWSLGDQVRANRERFAFVRERAAQLERDRGRSAQLAVLAERQRIARELHDVVAHGLSVVIVQADGALYAAAEHPDAPRQALAAISATGRESLAEMRRLLGVLREDADPAELVPQPGLSSIPDLIERFRDAGLTIEMTTEGSFRPVSPAVGLAAYRVIQESLTNVLKHAGQATVWLRVAFLSGQIGIQVTNAAGNRVVPLRASAVPGDAAPGLGLMGMRERVGLLNGRMFVGGTPSGGFMVQVEIPDGDVGPTGDAATNGQPSIGHLSGTRPA